MRHRAKTAGLLIVGMAAAARAAAQTSAPPPAPPAASDALPAKVTAYGAVYFNGFNNSGGTNNVDVPLWAVPGSGDTSATARQTRFGLRASLPRALGAKLAATVEADFFGGFPAIGTGENFGQLRLRLALARLDWAHTSLVIGQDWMVFAPANPSSLASAAIPLFAAAGNPWGRLPQIRLERRFGPGLLQAAVLAPQSGDFGSSFLSQPNSGALSKLPYFQARAALAPRTTPGGGRRANLGISGHYGRSRITPTGGTASRVESAGGAFDWSIPLGRYLLASGEAFLGRNLAGFQSGVFQGVNPDAVGSPAAAAAPKGIWTEGGWAQIVANPASSRLSLSAGFGIDDPDDPDLKSATARNWRLRNQVTALGVSFRASAELSVGVEYRFLETRLLQSGVQKDRHLNLAAVLGF